MSEAIDYGDDTDRDGADDYRHDTERAYETSDAFIEDALMWVADHGHDDAIIVAAAIAFYRWSAGYQCVIDDALDGYCRWAT